MQCDECGLIMVKDESITTIDGRILCYGCDSKRLIKEQ